MNFASTRIMLQPYLKYLSSQRVVLASSSPQRTEILQNIGFPFEVISSLFKEDLDKSAFEKPYEYAKENAKRKAEEVAMRLKNDKNPPYLIIGADTVVSIDGFIIEKPKDETDAYNMLKRLSGRSHYVYTGVAIILNPRFDSLKSSTTIFHEETEVLMAELDHNIITAYIETGEPLNKAGAYGIQKIGGTLIEAIHGDYFNVVGLPLHRLCKHLSTLLKETQKSMAKADS